MAMLEYSQNIVMKNVNYKEVHKCNVCKYFTNSIFLIRCHVRRHLLPRKTFNCVENTPEIFHCRDCDFKTDLTIFFKKHIQEIHLAGSENGDESQVVEYTTQNFICRYCTFETYSSLQWLKHQQVGCLSTEETQYKEAECQGKPCEGSQGFVYKQCSAKKETDIGVHVTRAHTENLFECYHCAYKTHKKRNLKGHMVKHMAVAVGKIKWYQCSHCPYKTKLKAHLSMHEICKHKPDSQINWFKCDHCEYKAKLKQSLKAHISMKHTEWRDIDLFHCDQCSHKTKRKRSLKKHKLIHLASNEVQWFQCGKCFFKTKYKRNLEMHNIIKHLTSEEIRWFQCDKCPYKAKSRSGLTHHITRLHLISKATAPLKPKLKPT